MTSAGSLDYTPALIASLLLAALLVFLALALFYGRRMFFGGADELKRELARKKREMEMFIEMQRGMGRLPAAPEKPVSAPVAPETPMPPLNRTVPARKERVKEQWEIEAEESEYKPQ